MELKTFSCFDNFVPSNNCGAPDHTPTHYALHHLERLLQGISQRLKAMPEAELVSAITPPKQDATEELEAENASVENVCFASLQTLQVNKPNMLMKRDKYFFFIFTHKTKI